MPRLRVEKVNHFNQVLGTFAEANAFYADVFDAIEYMNDYDDPQRRDASLFVVGDTCIELFAPRDGESLLGRTLARYGPAWHSFEWKVPDLDEARAAFTERGVRITTDVPGGFFMTHPRDGHGILFELCPFDMPGDPRLAPDWSAETWRRHPLGIDRLNALGVAVRDLDTAAAFLEDLTGAEILARGVRKGIGPWATLWIGDGCLELVQPGDDASPIAAYINTYGPRMRSLDFRVLDVERTASHLRNKGLHVVGGDDDGWIALDPADNYGVLYQFTADPLPGDPRP